MVNNLLKCISFLILSIGHVDAQNSESGALLAGQLKNFDNEVQVEDMSEISDLSLPDRERCFIPDSAGNFSLFIELASPNYFRLGRNILYLQPGDSVITAIDFNSPEDAQFDGKGADANMYLARTPFPKAGSYLSSGENIKVTVEETINEIYRLSRIRESELSAVRRSVDEEFFNLENMRIYSDILNSIFMIQVYYPEIRAPDSNAIKKMNEDISAAIRRHVSTGSNLFQAKYLKIQVYRSMLHVNLRYSNLAQSPKEILDWLEACALMRKIESVNEKKVLSSYNDSVDVIQTKTYRNVLKETIEGLQKLANGDIAINFVAKDFFGKDVNLKDFIGKVIYLDFWATWCIPCIELKESFEKLRDHYSEENNIVFVSISIDEDVERWKRFYTGFNLAGLQWNTSRLKLTDYRIASIPRFVVIDKSFRISSLYAAFPDENNIIDLLDRLISQ